MQPPASTDDSALLALPTRALPAWLARTGIRSIAWALCAGVIAATLFAWIGSVIFANKRIDAYLAQQREFAQADARLSAANLNLRLGQARSVMQTLAIDPSIVSALTRFGPHVERSLLHPSERSARWLSDPDLRALSERLNYVVKQFDLNTLWLTNAAGDTVAEGHADGVLAFVGTNYSDRNYFKSAQSGQLGRQFAVGRVTNIYGLFMSAPILVSEQFMGMVGISTSVPKFSTAIEGIDAVITDDLGVIVLAKDASLLMTTMPDATVNHLADEARNSRYKRVQFDAAGLQSISPNDSYSPFVMRKLAGTYVLANAVSEDGSLRVYAMRDLSASTDQYKRDQLAWFGLVFLLIVSLALLIAGVAQHLITTETQRIQLVQLNFALAREAQTDPLTGCANRRHFLQALDHERARALRQGLPMSLLSLDIDHFKHVNDTWGHAAGDEVLKQFVATVQGQLRQADLLGRMGGEEFSVLLPHASASDATQVAERIRAAIARSPVWFDGHRIDITVSIGGTGLTAVNQPVRDQLLAGADLALYEAKHDGRNRVKWHQTAVV